MDIFYRRNNNMNTCSICICKTSPFDLNMGCKKCYGVYHLDCMKDMEMVHKIHTCPNCRADLKKTRKALHPPISPTWDTCSEDEEIKHDKN